MTLVCQSSTAWQNPLAHSSVATVFASARVPTTTITPTDATSAVMTMPSCLPTLPIPMPTLPRICGRKRNRAASYDDRMAAGRLTQVTSVNGAFRARVLKARLESCGIDARLTGALDGVYGFTVGDMARVDVYVPEEQLDDARYVLLAGEVDAAMAAPSEWWDAGVEPRRRAALAVGGRARRSCSSRCSRPSLALFLRDW